MFGRIGACAAAAVVLAALNPSYSSAKSLGMSPPHTGSIAAHLHHHHGHHRHGHGWYRNGYGSPYGYGYDYGYPSVLLDNASEVRERIVPLAYPVYAGPRCMHSVETVIVPSELGGERKIRITRC